MIFVQVLPELYLVWNIFSKFEQQNFDRADKNSNLNYHILEGIFQWHTPVFRLFTLYLAFFVFLHH